MSSLSSSIGVELIMLGMMLIPLIIAVVFIVTKKRHPMIPTIEFYAPDDLNPAEVGYIIDEKINEHDVIALLYYWASHKHIAIEMGERKGQFTLTRLNKLDDHHTEYEKRFFSKIWTRSYLGLDYNLDDPNVVPEKTNSAELADHFKHFAKEVFRQLNTMFTKSDRRLTVKSRDTASSIVPTLACWMAMLLPSMHLIHSMGIGNYFSAAASSLAAVVVALLASRVGALLLLVPFVPSPFALLPSIIPYTMFSACMLFSEYNLNRYGYFDSSDPYTLLLGDRNTYGKASAIKDFTTLVRSGEIDMKPLLLPALAALLFILVHTAFHRARGKKRLKPSSSVFGNVFGLLLGAIACTAYTMSFAHSSISMWAAAPFALLLVLVLALSPIIRNYSEYGAYIIPRCEGFRQFLDSAEKERLEMLLDENPDYYYDVLPYAHALNVSDKWKDKFDGLDVRFSGS